MNIAYECLIRHAEDDRLADKVALVFCRLGAPDDVWTFGRAAQAVDRIARSLTAIGLKKGDRLLVRLDHSPEYALTFFAALRAGLIAVPGSPQLTAEETAFIVADSGAAAIVADHTALAGLSDEAESLRALRHVVVRGGDTPAAFAAAGTHRFEDMLAGLSADAPPVTEAGDPAYLIYTSGTTARSKGVLHAHRSLEGRRICVREWEHLTDADRVCHAGVLNWTYTLGVGLMDPWSVGATAILYDGPRRAEVWPALLERQAVTVFAAVPTVYRQILKYNHVEDFDWSSLRHGLTAGEPLPAAVHDEWKRRVGTELYEALGMTEISTYISFKPGFPVTPGACGRPQTGRPVRLVKRDGLDDAPIGEVGRIAVHRDDPGLMLGYWNRDAEEKEVFEGDWFIGGDLARADADGLWWFAGRADDLMTSFGYRVSPVEVESILAAHPDVAECAVTTVPVRDGSKHIITGFVHVKEGCAFDTVSLDRYCRKHLAAYKCPRAYRQVDKIPRTPNGKILRRALPGASATPSESAPTLEGGFSSR
ncbi:MAG: acyl-CoA synthetase [Deltaproteobacteria bacterium]|nr:acyl-CoA synthetase [Deltaproteobacteria bacterium]